jgi:ceramide glucosyltransferase
VQGLVTCFYRLANPETVAMKWEAIAINADFWSQVLQSKSLKPLDFALGAVMATRRKPLAEIGGFRVLADCLADDYQLGNRIARRGYPILLSPVVVECWAAPMGWRAVWKHQVRWARTIRVCQPVRYFFSLLNNGTFWPLLLAVLEPSGGMLGAAIGCWIVRVAAAMDLQRRIAVQAGIGVARGSPGGAAGKEGDGAGGLKRLGALSWGWGWLPLVKDLLQVAVWVMAFAGNTIEWRGERMRLRPDGTLAKE